MSEQRFEILELIDEDDGGISYLVSDGKTLIEVHDKKEYAIKLKRILDNEWWLLKILYLEDDYLWSLLIILIVEFQVFTGE